MTYSFAEDGGDSITVHCKNYSYVDIEEFKVSDCVNHCEDTCTKSTYNTNVYKCDTGYALSDMAYCTCCSDFTIDI